MNKTIYFTLLLFISACKPEPTEAQTTQEQVAQQFYTLLLTEQKQKSIELANKLPLNVQSKLLHQNITKYFESLKIKLDYYHDSQFNEIDYIFWQQALFFKKLSTKITKDSKDPIHALYKAVTQHLKKPKNRDMSAFPLDIWHRGYGLCDRQSWVLSELAYQFGADAYIIYFIEEDTGVSRHTICQIIAILCSKKKPN